MRSLTVGSVFLILAGAAYAQEPVAVFGFDEGGGRRALDASVHQRPGVVRHAVWVPGKHGTALSFAAPEAVVRLPRRPWLNLGTQLTLEAWVFPTIANEQSRIIIAKNDEYLLRMDKRSEGGRLSFFVHVGRPAVTWEPRVSSLAPPPLHAWSHVVATWDGARLRLYLNGDLQAEAERTGRPNPNPYPFMIGNFEYPSCHGGSFGGLLDEVRLYDRALSAEQARECFLVWGDPR
jgi:hypothetical protein